MGILPLRLSAVTTHPRHAFVAQLVPVLNDLGSVLDSHPFSNLALAIHFEVSRAKAPRLQAALTALPMSLSDPSLQALADLARAQTPELPEEIAGSLNITFVHQEPDLRRHIPAVPG